MTEKLSDVELSDRQLTFEDLKESAAWKLLEARVGELEIDFARMLGLSLIRSTRPGADSTITQDQMLTAFVDVAYKRGIIRGMGLIVREPEWIAKDFNAAFEERIS